MPKKIKFIVLSTLIGSIFSSLIASIAMASTLQSTQDKNNSNLYYYVANFRHDIWRYSDGSWTSAGEPDQDKTMSWPYSFDFPGREIKNVQIQKFEGTENLEINYVKPGLSSAEQVYENSRYGESWILNRGFSSVFYKPAISNLQGKGTSSVSFNVDAVGKLTAVDQWEDVTHLGGPGMSDGVEGRRYYFPMLLTIELEPIEGQAIIKYFTTTGQSLDGVDGFKNETKQLIKDQPYSFSHKQAPSNYGYKGYQQKNDDVPSGGPTVPTGDPPGFNYKGDFKIYYLFYYYEKAGTSNPDPPSDNCTSPTPSGQVREVPLTSPDPSAVIKADARGSERFNVLDGIPTTESLYGNVFAKSYLHKNKFVQYSGKCSFEVEVSREYNLKWDPGKKELGPDGKTEVTVPDPQEETETVTQTHTIERPYSFWTVENLEIYRINEAKLWNYAFEGGGITISPNGYSSPAFSRSETHGYTPPSPPASVVAPPSTVSGGKNRPNVPNEDLKSYAEKEVDPVKVKNDSLAFNGSTIMSGTEVSASGPSPASIPLAPQIGSNVLYSPGNVIPISKTNKANQPSTGSVAYTLMSGGVGGGTDASYPIHGMNTVTVHTPVVLYAGVSDDAEHNQKTIPTVGRSAIILERPFTVRMPNSGQHQNYLGYGYNDYLKYIGSKQIRFPFDVYSGSLQQQFIPKNTWIEVEKAKEVFEFYLPVWVDEGFYEVEVRTIAHNAPSGASVQSKANLYVQHHIAEDRVPVEVIGRMYDFRVTDIADYNWETVFRQSTDSALSTGVSYWVGPNGIDGFPRGIEQMYELPIAPGSHPVYRNVAVKTGYHFKFELKTKGNMFGLQDKIRITPSFYFVDGQSGKRQAVDLYYHAGNNRFVKIGSSADQLQRYVILNDRLRNVPLQELTDTALYKYDHDFSFAQIAGISRARYVENYIQKFTKQKTQVGSLSLMELNERIRTLIGPKNGVPPGVDSARVNAAIQKWYGEYSLPASVYAVPKGMIPAEYGRTHQGLTERSPIFLKEGYIVVNFNLETIQEGNRSQPHLQYIHAALMNQWTQMEGFQGATLDPYGRTFTVMDGDVLFYEADQSSDDDFRSMVIH